MILETLKGGWLKYWLPFRAKFKKAVIVMGKNIKKTVENAKENLKSNIEVVKEIVKEKTKAKPKTLIYNMPVAPWVKELGIAIGMGRLVLKEDDKNFELLKGYAEKYGKLIK